MGIDTILNNILYGLSGFCFGIFGSRYSVLSVAKLLVYKLSGGWGTVLTAGFPQLAFLLLAFIVFPLFFIGRTQIGGFVYYATLLFFFSKGYKSL